MDNIKQAFAQLPFSQAINQIDINKLNLFRKYVFPLDTATDNKEFTFAGNLFYMLDATDSNVEIQARFNELGENAITMTKGLGIGTPFKKVFLTWEAQAGKTATILVGVEAPELLYLIDNRSAAQTTSVLESIRDDLRGDTAAENWGVETVGTSAVKVVDANTDRKSASIQASLDNTGIIYIGFANTVSASNYVAVLEAGDSFGVDDYRGDLYCISDTASQEVGFGEV